MKSIKNLCMGFAIVGMSVTSVSCGSGGNILGDLLTTSASILAGGTTETLAGYTGSSSTKSQLITAGATVLTQVVGNMLQGAGEAGGITQQYTGTYTGQLLVYNKSAKQYENTGKLVTKSNATTTLIVGSTSTGITMPTITAGDATMSQVTLTNLVATNGVYGLSEQSTVTEGKLTYKNQSYDLANAYVELKYDNSSCEYSASIYFNYDESTKQYLQAMNVTFK